MAAQNAVWLSLHTLQLILGIHLSFLDKGSVSYATRSLSLGDVQSY